MRVRGGSSKKRFGPVRGSLLLWSDSATCWSISREDVGCRISGFVLSLRCGTIQDFPIQLWPAVADGAVADSLVQLDTSCHDLIALPGVFRDHGAFWIDEHAALGMHEGNENAVFVGARPHHRVIHLPIPAPGWNQYELGALDGQNARGLRKLAIVTDQRSQPADGCIGDGELRALRIVGLV